MSELTNTVICECDQEVENPDPIYTDYSDQDFDYFYPISFDKRNKVYLQLNQTPAGSWNYGDTVEIVFTIEVIEGALEGKMLEVTFYNFRYEEVETAVEPAGDLVIITIDEETSKQSFKRGNYYCGVKLKDEEQQTSLTILDPQSCLLYVE